MKISIRKYLGLKRLDTYIIGKFIGTYVFSILLIISISIVFDLNENLAGFTEFHAPLRAIVFDYYLNFIPYYTVLFSSLFIFISVIFFTTKLAGNSEIVAMLSAGASFNRLLRPYIISAAMISAMNFYLASYVIPNSNVIRQNFETIYKNKRRVTTAENVQLQVGKGVVAYIEHYDNVHKMAFNFSLDKFENKKLVSHMSASTLRYDTISNERYHWHVTNWRIRELKGMREVITSGAEMDTVVMMEPMDLVFTKGQQETFTSPELLRYISKQQDRGSTNVVQYQVEYYKRIANSFAAFILTIIGASLSAQKRKRGMGLSLGIGLVLSFTYILLQTISASFAIKAGFHPMLASWMPNIIFVFVAFFCYLKAPR
ncbi:MAG: LptF/LptG family permease [Prevotella sp.]|nr:LptF/LptG family permease [Candidatus Equicola stercoris]